MAQRPRRNNHMAYKVYKVYKVYRADTDRLAVLKVKNKSVWPQGLLLGDLLQWQVQQFLIL